MPLINSSSYQAPFYYFNSGHWQTIVPSVFRKIQDVNYVRERIYTPDHDFIDLDWAKIGSKKLVLVLHGLEGNTHRHYVKGMIKTFNEIGFDGLGYNFRSCSGEINALPRIYYHGDTNDLDVVMNHVLQTNDYQSVVLVGFSMGANTILKYLGEKGSDVSTSIQTAFTVSAPCHLADCSNYLELPKNFIYKKRFLDKLLKKLILKSQTYPSIISLDQIRKIRTFKQFDDLYTAPLHGFSDHLDYYTRSSCESYLPNIKIPSYLLSAANDPLLPKTCFPTKFAKNSATFYLEMPSQGGHVGFEIAGTNQAYSEKKAVDWVRNFFDL